MSEKNNETRSERYKNRGRSNMIMKLALGLVGLIVLIFILEFFIGGNNDNDNPDQLAGSDGLPGSSMIVQDSEESSQEGTDEAEESSEVSSESSAESESESEEEDSEEEDVETREIDSNDPNVIRAIAGDWPPVGTDQSEPHVTNYDDGSADRIEIKRATSIATGVAENDMIENWIGNNGEQRVTATITEISTGDIYKTYLTWIPEEGWQVTHYEGLRAVIE